MSTTISQVGVPQVPVETVADKKNQPTLQRTSFKAKTRNDEFVKKYEVEATSGKKWGVGIASAFVPGLGQAINGQWGKAFGFFLGTAALGVGAQVAMLKSKIGMAAAAGLGCLGLGIATIVDAVKNAKSEVQVVDKEV